MKRYVLIQSKFAFLIFLTSILCWQTVFASPLIEEIKLYNKTLSVSVEKRLSLAADINRYRHAEDLWVLLREEFRLNHYEDNPLVQYQITWFLNHQDFLLHSATRSAPYLYYILHQVRKRHLPVELVLLPMIESAYNPFAYSTEGAAGIWQMMPRTASGYGIKQNWWYDGRRDVVASTRAALDYLYYLSNFFNNNWLLALAAYDTGEGNVTAAINKNIRQGYSTEFWSLPVAQETKEYVPRLLALATIIAHPERYPIRFPFVRNAPYLAQVDVGGQIDLSHAAALAGMNSRKLMQLNPGYNRRATDPAGPYKITLPIENVEQFTRNLASLPVYQHQIWERYKIKRGETLTVIAKRFNTTLAALHMANSQQLRHFKTGTELMVPHNVTTLTKALLDSPQPIFAVNNEPNFPKKRVTVNAKHFFAHRNNNEDVYTLQAGDTLYMVRRKDSIQKIAKRFHLPQQTLYAVNKLSFSRNVQPGDRLIIPTHLHVNNNGMLASRLKPGDTLYKIRHGDTVESIAKKFNALPLAIRVINSLDSNVLTVGDNIVIPAHSL